jgi:hypothetical protein
MDVVMQPDRLAAAKTAQIAPLKELTPPPHFSLNFSLAEASAAAPEVNRDLHA